MKSSKSLLGWHCAKCTFFHNLPSPRCAMCGELKNATREQMRDFIQGKPIPVKEDGNVVELMSSSPIVEGNMIEVALPSRVEGSHCALSKGAGRSAVSTAARSEGTASSATHKENQVQPSIAAGPPVVLAAAPTARHFLKKRPSEARNPYTSGKARTSAEETTKKTVASSATPLAINVDDISSKVSTPAASIVAVSSTISKNEMAWQQVTTATANTSAVALHPPAPVPLSPFVGTKNGPSRNQARCSSDAPTRNSNVAPHNDTFTSTPSQTRPAAASNPNQMAAKTAPPDALSRLKAPEPKIISAKKAVVKTGKSYLVDAKPRPYAPGPVPLCPETAQTWIYPHHPNYSSRQYQLEITETAVQYNTLVSLPTGLGKTLIAAVVMYNYWRWFPTGKVIFLAPTLPLVNQQVQACYKIMGLPASITAIMTGKMGADKRLAHWQERTFFYCTPQTVQKDLSGEHAATFADQVVCLVLDEAHKASGDYAYVKVVEQLEAAGAKFRIVGLSATPGTSIKAIQQVVQALRTCRIEARQESDPTVQPYLHEKHSEIVIVPKNDSQRQVERQLSNMLAPPLEQLRQVGAIRLYGNATVTSFGILQARRDFGTRNGGPIPGQLLGLFSVAQKLVEIRNDAHQSLGVVKAKLLRLRNEPQRGQLSTVVKSPAFDELLKMVLEATNPSQSNASLSQQATSRNNPKLAKLSELLTEHFCRAQACGKSSRVIVFSQFRDSVSEIVSLLRRLEPAVRPHHFVGQGKPPSKGAKAKNSSDSDGGMLRLRGMKQSEQQQVIQQFRNDVYNVLVCTCIGEEGLDIGEVDLIVNYDTLRSPIRMIQRTGRTGRARDGRVVCLIAEGQEQKTFEQSKQAEKTLMRALAKKSNFTMNPHHPMLPTPPGKEYTTMKISSQLHLSQVAGASASSSAPRKQTKYKLDGPQEQERQQRMGNLAVLDTNAIPWGTLRRVLIRSRSTRQSHGGRTMRMLQSLESFGPVHHPLNSHKVIRTNAEIFTLFPMEKPSHAKSKDRKVKEVCIEALNRNNAAPDPSMAVQQTPISADLDNNPCRVTSDTGQSTLELRLSTSMNNRHELPGMRSSKGMRPRNAMEQLSVNGAPSINDSNFGTANATRVVDPDEERAVVSLLRLSQGRNDDAASKNRETNNTIQASETQHVTAPTLPAHEAEISAVRPPKADPVFHLPTPPPSSSEDEEEGDDDESLTAQPHEPTSNAYASGRYETHAPGMEAGILGFQACEVIASGKDTEVVKRPTEAMRENAPTEKADISFRLPTQSSSSEDEYSSETEADVGNTVMMLTPNCKSDAFESLPEDDESIDVLLSSLKKARKRKDGPPLASLKKQKCRTRTSPQRIKASSSSHQGDDATLEVVPLSSLKNSKRKDGNVNSPCVKKQKSKKACAPESKPITVRVSHRDNADLPSDLLKTPNWKDGSGNSRSSTSPKKAVSMGYRKGDVEDTDDSEEEDVRSISLRSPAKRKSVSGTGSSKKAKNEDIEYPSKGSIYSLQCCKETLSSGLQGDSVGDRNQPVESPEFEFRDISGTNATQSPAIAARPNPKKRQYIIDDCESQLSTSGALGISEATITSTPAIRPKEGGTNALEDTPDDVARTMFLADTPQQASNFSPGLRLDPAMLSCSICFSRDSLDEDPIVLCDGCNIGFHTTCFSINASLDSNEPWFCDSCHANGNGIPPGRSCALCGLEEGPMKKSGENTWYHPLCQPFLRTTELTSRSCSTCSADGGARCFSCSASIHPYCAINKSQQGRWTIVVLESTNLEISLKSSLFCPEHTDNVNTFISLHASKATNGSLPRVKVVQSRHLASKSDGPKKLTKARFAPSNDSYESRGERSGANESPNKILKIQRQLRRRQMLSRFVLEEADIASHEDMEGDNIENDEVRRLEDDELSNDSFINDSIELTQHLSQDALREIDPDASIEVDFHHRSLDAQHDRDNQYKTPLLNRRMNNPEDSQYSSSSQKGLGNMHFIRSVLEHHRHGGRSEDIEACFHQVEEATSRQDIHPDAGNIGTPAASMPIRQEHMPQLTVEQRARIERNRLEAQRRREQHQSSKR